MDDAIIVTDAAEDNELAELPEAVTEVTAEVPKMRQQRKPAPRKATPPKRAPKRVKEAQITEPSAEIEEPEEPAEVIIKPVLKTVTQTFAASVVALCIRASIPGGAGLAYDADGCEAQLQGDGLVRLSIPDRENGGCNRYFVLPPKELTVEVVK